MQFTDTNQITLSNADPLPFHGYRQIRATGGFERGTPESYSTIEHFYQSEKFRGVDESFRKFIMSLPTAREARKAARKRIDVRPDWEQIRNRVMATGIWFKLLEHDRYSQALLANPQLAEDAYAFRDHYWGDLRKDVSIGFYRRILLDYRERRRNGIMRVVITGSSSFTNQELFNDALRVLFKRRIPDEILINCDRGTDAMAERWAISHCIPVRHFPLRGSQSKVDRSRRANDVLRVATHAVIFWKGKSTRIAEFAQATKERDLPTRIFKLDESDNVIGAPKGRRPAAAPRAVPPSVRT